MHPGQKTTEVSGADKGAASNIRKIILRRRAAETVIHTLVMYLVFRNAVNTSFRSSSIHTE